MSVKEVVDKGGGKSGWSSEWLSNSGESVIIKREGKWRRGWVCPTGWVEEYVWVYDWDIKSDSNSRRESERVNLNFHTLHNTLTTRKSAHISSKCPLLLQRQESSFYQYFSINRKPKGRNEKEISISSSCIVTNESLIKNIFFSTHCHCSGEEEKYERFSFFLSLLGK